LTFEFTSEVQYCAIVM